MSSFSEKQVHVLTAIDGVNEELVDLVEIKGFDLDQFAVQFDVDRDSDPEMLERYSVGPDDVSFLEGVLGQKLNLDFSKLAYFIEAATK